MIMITANIITIQKHDTSHTHTSCDPLLSEFGSYAVLGDHEVDNGRCDTRV